MKSPLARAQLIAALALPVLLATDARAQNCNLPPVGGVFASDSLLCDGVSITWPAVPGATGYRVFRRTGGSSLVTFDVTNPYHFDASALPGITYDYAVAARSATCPNPTEPSLPRDSGSAPPFEMVTVTQPCFAAPGEPFEFLAVVDGALAANTTYQWYRNGVPMGDGGRITGTQSPILRIDPLLLADTDLYSVRVTTPLGSRTLETSVLARPRCRGDFNGLGGVSVQDLFDFLAAFFAGCP